MSLAVGAEENEQVDATNNDKQTEVALNADEEISEESDENATDDENNDEVNNDEVNNDEVNNDEENNDEENNDEESSEENIDEYESENDEGRFVLLIPEEKYQSILMQRLPIETSQWQ